MRTAAVLYIILFIILSYSLNSPVEHNAILAIPPIDIHKQFINDVVYPTVLLDINDGSGGCGSGVLVSNKLVLTAAHVADVWVDNSILTIRDGESRHFGADVISINREDDWAILSISYQIIHYYGTSIHILPHGITHTAIIHSPIIAHVGEEVLAVGYPLGIEHIEISIGIIGESLGREGTHSAPVCYGNSGGPVFLKGTHELIGINISIAVLKPDISIFHMVRYCPLTKDIIDEINNH